MAGRRPPPWWAWSLMLTGAFLVLLGYLLDTGLLVYGGALVVLIALVVGRG